MDRRDHHRGVLTALALVALASLATWAPAPAAAQGDPSVAARAAFDEGVAALEAGRFADAARAFERSYTLAPRVATLCNLAVTFDRWGGHSADALDYYERCAAEDDSGRFAAHARERAEALRREAQAAPPTPDPTPLPIAETPPPVEPAPEPDVRPEWQNAPAATSAGPSRRPLFAILSAVSGALAVGALVPAILLADGASQDLAWIEAQGHPVDGEGRVVVPPGSDSEARLDDANGKSTASWALYAASGVLGALAVTFFILHFALPERPVAVGVAPLESGAFVAVRAPL